MPDRNVDISIQMYIWHSFWPITQCVCVCLHENVENGIVAICNIFYIACIWINNYGSNFAYKKDDCMVWYGGERFVVHLLNAFNKLLKPTKAMYCVCIQNTMHWVCCGCGYGCAFAICKLTLHWNIISAATTKINASTVVAAPKAQYNK